MQSVASTPSAERRLCSVLFGDLVGFTPLSEARDPEVVRELLSRYFDTARTVISRYGGVVEKFIGDAVMAVWGTPVATEGDAERAVRAGLDLVAAVTALGTEVGAPGLALRAGIVTGEVAVTLGATGEGMVAGDAVNTAARVQSTAVPGQVWVDEPTRRLVAAAIALDDAGEHVLKGKAEPQHLFHATRVLSGVGGSQRVDGLEAPLVGRDAELRLLKDTFHATSERRNPRLVVVSGPAGVGKSRLGWEFEKYLDGLAEAAWWHRGRCLSYGDGIAYWALAEIVRQRFGIAEEDPLELAAVKLVELLPKFVPDAAEQAYVGPRLARLLGVSYPEASDAALGREELYAGWRLFFERLSDTGPVVMLIEDAQYADTALLDFVDHLVDWARNAPIYVMVFARQELIEQHPGFGAGRNRTLVALDLLDARSMDEMVDALVPGMPAAAVAAIAEQAQGNPLFAIETVRSLIDRDIVVPRDGRYVLAGEVHDLQVPDSLHGLLAARLDALDPDARSLLADASVLGTTFPAESLVAVSGRGTDQVETALGDLVRRGVLEISADPLSPQRGSYFFAQNLLRQVAYDTMSRRDRRARHLAVAAHLQNTFDGDEIMEVVARHYLDALAAVEDDDDAHIRARAVDALLRAGERAGAAGAPRRAARDFAHVAELTAQAGGAEVEVGALWERAADSARVGGDHEAQYAYAERARDLYLGAGLTRQAALATTTMGAAVSYSGQLKQARDLLLPALEQVRSERDEDTVNALREVALVLLFGSEPEQGAVLVREALVLGQELDLPDGVLAGLLIVQGIACIVLNERVEGEAVLAHAVRLAERAGDNLAHARGLLNLSALTTASDPVTSVGYARGSYELSRRVGARYFMTAAMSNAVPALILSGDWAAAESFLHDAIEGDGLDREEEVDANVALLAALRGELAIAREKGRLDRLRISDDAQSIGQVIALDAFIAHAAGDSAEALRLGQQLIGQSQGLGLVNEQLMLTVALTIRAAFEVGDLAAVEDLLARLAARPIGHVPPLLRAESILARARLAAARGEPGAERGFADAIARLRAFGSAYHLAHALLDLAEYLQAAGRDAATPIAEAAEIAQRLGAAPLAARAESVRAVAAPS